MFCLKPRQSPLAPRCFLYWYTKLLSYQAYFVTHLPTIWPPLIKQESLVPSRSIIKKHVHIFVTGDVIHFESSPILEAGHMSCCHDDVYKVPVPICPSRPIVQSLSLSLSSVSVTSLCHCGELWSLSSSQQTNSVPAQFLKTLFWLRALCCSSGPLVLHWPGLGHYYNQITPASPNISETRQ